MPATVITGLFSTAQVVWTGSSGGPTVGYAVIPNTTNGSITFTGATLSGANPGSFSIPAGQFPVTVNPGQSVIIQVNLNSNAVVSAVLNVNGGSYNPTVALSNIQLDANNAFPGGATASRLVFPNTKVGQSSTFNNYVIVNGDSVNPLTINNLAMATGTSFFLTGAPVVPFTIPAGGSSALFGIQFTPTTTGGLLDTLVVTSNVTGTTNVGVQGVGTNLQSAFSITGSTLNMLFAFAGAGGVNPVLAQVANSLNTEEPGSFVRLHDFGLVNQEKQVMRIRGHYEDIGSAIISFKCRARRVNQPDEIITVQVNIGVFGDGWIREFTSEPTPITGELVQITASRAANSGPVSLIDYAPEFEPKGAVIGGT